MSGLNDDTAKERSEKEMSFLVAVHVNEGIVLASDRRTTYTNTQTIENKVVQRIGIHTTNSTDKTFACFYFGSL